MATYILLMNWTNEGINQYVDDPAVEQGKEPREVKDRLREAVNAFVDEAKGKVDQWLLTFGEYDIVSVIELPHDLDVAALALKLRHDGIRTKTLRVFEADERTITIMSMIRSGSG